MTAAAPPSPSLSDASHPSHSHHGPSNTSDAGEDHSESRSSDASSSRIVRTTVENPAGSSESGQEHLLDNRPIKVKFAVPQTTIGRATFDYEPFVRYLDGTHAKTPGRDLPALILKAEKEAARTLPLKSSAAGRGMEIGEPEWPVRHLVDRDARSLLKFIRLMALVKHRELYLEMHSDDACDECTSSRFRCIVDRVFNGRKKACRTCGVGRGCSFGKETSKPALSAVPRQPEHERAPSTVRSRQEHEAALSKVRPQSEHEAGPSRRKKRRLEVGRSDRDPLLLEAVSSAMDSTADGGTTIRAPSLSPALEQDENTAPLPIEVATLASLCEAEESSSDVVDYSPSTFDDDLNSYNGPPDSQPDWDPGSSSPPSQVSYASTGHTSQLEPTQLSTPPTSDISEVVAIDHPPPSLNKLPTYHKSTTQVLADSAPKTADTVPSGSSSGPLVDARHASSFTVAPAREIVTTLAQLISALHPPARKRPLWFKALRSINHFAKQASIDEGDSAEWHTWAVGFLSNFEDLFTDDLVVTQTKALLASTEGE